MNDPIAALVRQHDPDRFLTALFAPAEKRQTLLTLYAFNHELARAREVASEPTLALIRLQWWREVAEGEPKRHEVASPLTEAIRAGLLHPDDLLAIIDAREIEAEDRIETRDAWRSWLLAGAGGLVVAAGRLLGAPEPEALRPFGAAFAVSGLLRSVPVLAAQGRCLLPADLLDEHGLVPEAVISDPNVEGMLDVGQALVREGERFLDEVASVKGARAWIAAVLPAVLARRDLGRWPRVDRPRRFGDRWAVTYRGLTGRI
jgi:phytoene synthase